MDIMDGSIYNPDPKKKEKNRISLATKKTDHRAQRPYECFCCYSRVEILNITPHLSKTDILSIATLAFEEPGSKYIFFEAALFCIVFPSKVVSVYTIAIIHSQENRLSVSFRYLIFSFSYTVLKS